MIQSTLHNYLDSKLNSNVTILQIGGNDGNQDDFIKPLVSQYTNTTLHTLEPIPQFFNELQQAYKNYNNVYCYNYAITNKSGTDYINYIPYNTNMPIWLKGCSSFFTNKNIIDPYWQNIFNDNNINNYIKNNLTKLLVQTLTFNDFTTKYNINNFDILVIDTEGYECEILKQIDLYKFTPHIIILEFHNHSNIDKNTIQNILSNNNYNYHILPTDLIAIKHI